MGEMMRTSGAFAFLILCLLFSVSCSSSKNSFTQQRQLQTVSLPPKPFTPALNEEKSYKAQIAADTLAKTEKLSQISYTDGHRQSRKKSSHALQMQKPVNTFPTADELTVAPRLTLKPNSAAKQVKSPTVLFEILLIGVAVLLLFIQFTMVGVLAKVLTIIILILLIIWFIFRILNQIKKWNPFRRKKKKKWWQFWKEEPEEKQPWWKRKKSNA